MTNFVISGSFSAAADEGSSTLTTKVFSVHDVAVGGEQLINMTAYSDAQISGSVSSSFQVSDDKTMTLQMASVTWRGSGADYVNCTLRVTGSGQTLSLSSPALVTWAAGGAAPASNTCVMTWPLGFKLPAGTVLGVSTYGGSGRFDMSLVGFEE